MTETLKTLHSTMFLLILKKHDNYYVAGPVFTFHNVSINTGTGTNATIDSIIFTFHNVSINTKAICGQLKIEVSLHSTMFLLILRSKRGQG